VAQVSGEISMIALICACVLAPPIRFSDAFPYLRAEQVLLAIVFVGYAWLSLAGYARKIHFNGMFVIGTLYAFCVALSTWYGADMLHHQVIFRDFYEIPKVLFPVLFFTVAYEAELSEKSLQMLFKAFGMAVLLVCVYAWGQFVNLGFTHQLNNFYSGGEHIDLLLRYVGRVYSTMANPNVLGQLMSWCLAAFTMAALAGVGSRIWNIVLAFACLITLAMTASRYGLITASLGILLIFAFPSASGRRRTAQLVLLLILLPVFALTFKTVATANRSGIQRIQTLKDPLHTDSLQGRLDVRWVDAAHDIARSPWIGNGSAKEFFGDIITDSEYLDTLKQFGIVGFSVYLANYFFPLYLLWKGLKSGQRPSSKFEERMPATLLTIRLSFVMIILALAMSIGESTFTNLLLQGFLWMWMGLGARCAQTLRDASRRVVAPAPVRRVLVV
jgi:O-antigen ligase